MIKQSIFDVGSKVLVLKRGIEYIRIRVKTLEINGLDPIGSVGDRLHFQLELRVRIPPSPIKGDWAFSFPAPSQKGLRCLSDIGFMNLWLIRIAT